LILFAVFLAAVAAAAAAAQPDAVDQYMEQELARRKIPGAALAVIRDGAIVKMRGYGVASVELGVPVSADSVFELASVTKQFTATAIMLLVEEGKVRLDDPIGRFLPGAPGKWDAIKVRHLLTHTAGLPGLEKNFASLAKGDWLMNYSTKAMFESAKLDEISFAPGERHQYSDVGYFLLGMIIEQASGGRYRDFLDERFFKPLGMSETSVIDQWQVVKNRAPGYTLRNGRLVRIRRDVQVELPSHYGVLSSVRDLAKWDAALASGKVVKPATLNQMWTGVTLNDGSYFPYGFGWYVDERRGHRLISHTGITGTEYSRYPDDGVVVIVLTNLGTWPGGTGVNSWGLAHGVAGRYIGGMLLEMAPAEPDKDPRRRDALLEMLSSIAGGGEAALATPKLRSLIPASSAKIIATRLKEMRSFTFITCDRGGNAVRLGAAIAQVCHYKMVTGDETRYYSFWLTPEAKVADFRSATE
jgi:CubicO group peptidase (beta-lactamase class C family)